jgi:hypothetical protein
MLIAVLLVPAIASACPLCKDTIASSSNAQASYGLFSGGISSGFNLSIYFMFAGFFSTLGLASGVIVRGVRSTNNKMKPPTD